MIARRLGALVCSVVVALGAVAATPRPVAAACQFYCDTVELSLVAGGLPGAGGTGTVTSSDGRIDCFVVNGQVQGGSVCSFRYTIYTVTFPYTVELSFQPETGSYVCLASDCKSEGVGFVMDYVLDPPYQQEAIVDQDYYFFLSRRKLYISTGFSGGYVRSQPAGIDCGAQCVASFSYGEQVALTATADPGSVFLAWQGDCAAQTTNPCTLSMVDDHTTRPIFGPAPTAVPTPTPTARATQGAGPTATPHATPAATRSATAPPATLAPGEPTSGAVPTNAGATTQAPGTAPESGATSQGAGASPAAVSSAATSAWASAAAPAAGAPVGAATASTPSDLTPVVLAIVVGALVIALGIVAAALIGRRRPVEGRRD